MVADAGFPYEKLGQLVQSGVGEPFQIAVNIVVAQDDGETINIVGGKLLHAVLIYQLDIGGSVRLRQLQILQFLHANFLLSPEFAIKNAPFGAIASYFISALSFPSDG